MMMKHRLVVVSNRVGPIRNTRVAGGLAVALVEALKEHGGLWFGWSGEVAERVRTRPHIEHHGALATATLDLAPDDYDEYYNGFANTTLWPILHYRLDLAIYDREHYTGYLRVNQRFARALSRQLKRHDLVWVHDYHLIPFGEELRRMGHQHRIGFFLHIPFPPPEILTALPTHEQLVRALFAYDVIGFQTEGDRRCFLEYVIGEAKGVIHTGDRVTAFGRTIVAGVFPIGIDTDGFAGLTESKDAVTHFKRMQQSLAPKKRVQILGVDRLDYTKGLPERFAAYEELLRRYPENRGRVMFVQIAPLSRVEAHGYGEIRQRLEGMAGSINAEFSEFDWTPLRYINRTFGRRALAGIYRASRVGLVTPLRDGMNLVAKEYVAAQNPANPGVLVLSRFAGAARQLDGALVVNPYDRQSVADALQTALNMALAERRERWRSMMDNLSCHDVDAWRNKFIERLMAPPPGTAHV